VAARNIHTHKHTYKVGLHYYTNVRQKLPT